MIRALLALHWEKGKKFTESDQSRNVNKNGKVVMKTFQSRQDDSFLFLGSLDIYIL